MMDFVKWRAKIMIVDLDLEESWAVKNNVKKFGYLPNLTWKDDERELVTEFEFPMTIQADAIIDALPRTWVEVIHKALPETHLVHFDLSCKELGEHRTYKEST